MSNIEDFIHAVDSGSKVDAGKIFNTMMQDRLSTALDSKKAEIANTVYNGSSAEEEIEVEQPEPEEEFDVDVQGTEEESE